MPIAGDEVMKSIGELVAKHSLSGCKKVLVGDVEVSLCTIEHYMKHVGQLNLGYDAQALTVFLATDHTLAMHMKMNRITLMSQPSSVPYPRCPAVGTQGP